MNRPFKKLFASLCTTSLILTPLATTKADEIDAITRIFSYAVAEDPQAQDGLNLYKIDSDGSASLLESNIFPDGGPNTFTTNDMAVDNIAGKIYFKEPPRGNGETTLRVRVFDVKTEQITGWQEITGFAEGAQPVFVAMPDISSDKIEKKCDSSDGSSCADTDEKSIALGGEDMEVVIDSEGISVNGKDLIKETSTGEVHIGENSLVTRERNSRQELYATDANGNAIDINVTNGSNLLIDGVSVQGQIDDNASNISTNTTNIKNLGEGVAGSTALTAALSALPQTSKESKLSCGVGTGAYSSRYAVGFGCASKVNERVDINAGGSYVFGGSKSYGGGTLDSGVIKAGFVFKLGKMDKTTQISMKEKEELKQEISDLKANNINIISQNKALLARLERLEKIALGESKSKDLATIKLP